MNNICLTKTEFERLLKVFGWLLIVIGLLIFFVQFHFFHTSPFSAAWKAFCSSLSICVLVIGIISRLSWRCKILARLMNRPIVHGLWKGELRSNYGAVGEERITIPIFLVIRQTYLTLSIQSFTERQDGESSLESLWKSSKTDSVQLSYIFKLNKFFSGASSATNGTGVLKLAGDKLSLKGIYWTNAPTHGEISLELISSDCENISSYSDAQKKHDSALSIAK